MNPKQRAADAALDILRDGMVVGLGTGSTSECFLRALAGAIKSGRLRDIRGIATSFASERFAAELGIPLAHLSATCRPDVTVDGADEITPTLDLIKGLGGALLREKVIAQNSKRMVIIADASKRVDRLGTRSPLPVEVTPFGHEAHEPFFRSLGCTPTLRRRQDGAAFLTDNGNYIYDCRFNGIDDAQALLDAILHRAGVMDCGLFLNMATLALVADDNTVHELHRPSTGN